MRLADLWLAAAVICIVCGVVAAWFGFGWSALILGFFAGSYAGHLAK